MAVKAKKLSLGRMYSVRRALAKAAAKVTHLLAASDLDARAGVITRAGVNLLLAARRLLDEALGQLVVAVDVPARMNSRD